jgi:hypothetical protein
MSEGGDGLFAQKNQQKDPLEPVTCGGEATLVSGTPWANLS